MGDTGNDDDDDDDDWWVYEGQERKDVPKDVKRVRIGPEVERIKKFAFYEHGLVNQHGLETLDFSEAKALRIIEGDAFSKCESLRGTLRFPPQLQEIQWGAFFHCDQIEKIDLTDAKALKGIGHTAFHTCSSLKTAVLPASITEFGIDVFKYCPKLELVRILGDNFFVALRVAAHSPPTGNNGPLPKEDCRSTNNLVALYSLQPMQPKNLAKRHNEELDYWKEEGCNEDYAKNLHSKETEKLQEIKSQYEKLSHNEVNELVRNYRQLQGSVQDVTGVQHFKSDKADGDDKFGLKDIADALGSTIATTELEAPFVMGILGGWGSGKSFMMNMIKKRLIEIQSKDVRKTGYSDQSPYVGHMYSVNFDAWTFAKGSLWASLMHSVLVQLNRQLEIERLLRDIKGDKKLPGISIIEIAEKLEENKKKYLRKICESEEKRKELRNFLAAGDPRASKALIDAINDSDDNDRQDLEDLQWKKEMHDCPLSVRRAVERAVKELKSDEEAQATLTEALNSILGKNNKGFLQSLKKVWIFGDTILQLLQNPIALLYLSLWAGIVAFAIVSFENIGMVISVVSPAFPALAVFVMKMKEFWDKIKDLKGHPVASTTVDILKRAIKNRNQLEQENIEQIDERIAMLQERVLLVQGESLTAFVKDRISDQDYEKELGVVHQAQQDLKRISDCISNNKKNKEIFPRGHPRIFLFIDDLDRCPPAKVVEMLEALQLLVKTDLFVVIVAIDSRFISLCLEKQYTEILDSEKSPTGIDYVEKILQITYRVPSIGVDKIDGYLEEHLGFQIQEERLSRKESYPEAESSTQNRPSRSPEAISEGKKNTGEAKRQEDEEKQSIEEVKEEAESSTQNRPSRSPEAISEGKKNTGEAKRQEDEEKQSIGAEEQADLGNKATEPQVPAIQSERQEEEPKTQAEVFELTTPYMFTPEEMSLISLCCKRIKMNPRSMKRFLNVMKVVFYVWKETKQADDNFKNACVSILAISCASSNELRQELRSLLKIIEELGCENFKNFEEGNGSENGVVMTSAETLWGLADECLEDESPLRKKLKSFIDLWKAATWKNYNEFKELQNELNLSRSFALLGDRGEKHFKKMSEYRSKRLQSTPAPGRMQDEIQRMKTKISTLRNDSCAPSEMEIYFGPRN